MLLHLGGVDTHAREQPGTQSLLLSHQDKKDVLGADVVVSELESLTQRESRVFFASGVKWGRATRGLVAAWPQFLDPFAHVFGGYADILQGPRRHAFALMMRPSRRCSVPDAVVVEKARLFLGQDGTLQAAVGESFERGPSLPRRARHPQIRCTYL